MIPCPLCGIQFRKEGACRGCGLASACTLVRCPNCGYEFPLPFFQKSNGRDSGDLIPLAEAVRGMSYRVVSMATNDHHRNRMFVLGISPGRLLTVRQKSPACVVRVEETDIALDEVTTRGIIVMRSDLQ